jgi:outer membrane protein OmpA-like peptidoglycan-associated protein
VKRFGELKRRADRQGYGQDKPMAHKGTAEGRVQNRRIQFTVVKRPARI